MSWWPRRRRDRTRDPYDWFEDEFFGRGFLGRDSFRDVDESFRQTREDMAKILDRARKGELQGAQNGGPYVYGWSLRVGPDGVPHFEEFGNTKGLKTGPAEGLPSGREPLVDVIEAETEVKVTAELPGVEKKDVELETTEESLTIKVDTEKRKYFKEVALPTTVKADSAKATYNNGVLEVGLEKKTQEQKGKKIDIE
jgi:HSP20 family protein